MHSQDEQLEGVSYTVGNLQQQAREMGDELEDQVMYLLFTYAGLELLTLSNRILEDLDQRVEGTYDKLKRGSKRLQRFILANEGELIEDRSHLTWARIEIELLYRSAHRHSVHTAIHGRHDID